MLHLTLMHLQSALFFEAPEELYARVFQQIRPRTAVPAFRVSFCEFANANSSIRMQDDNVEVRITDVLKDAPAPVMEALAFILISKLYRKPIPRSYSHRYRLYLNRKDVRHRLHDVRRRRGRKQASGPEGLHYDLHEVFDTVNGRYFHGLMSRPNLGWSRRPSRTTLGHYDPSHHAIVLSNILDRPDVPRIAVEYVMFHEMLHVRYPVEHKGIRRCVHTLEFKLAEKEFEQLTEAKEILKKL